MRIRLLVVGLFVALLGAALPALAATPAPVVSWRSATAVQGDLGPATVGWATRAAGRLLGAHDLRIEAVKHSLVGTHVRGRQYRAGLPIQGTDWLATAIGGRVVQVAAHPTALPGSPASRPITSQAAQAKALLALGVRTLLAPPHVTRLLMPRGRGLVDTYRVSVLSRVGPAVVQVAARDGRVLATGDDAKRVDGSATLFDPNPVVTKRDSTLRQPLETGSPLDPDLDSAELTAQLRTLPLRELDSAALSAGRLSGPYVDIQGYGYDVGTRAPTFDLTRSDPRFEGLMAYAHLDRYQRYLQSLGLRGPAAVNAEPQDVYAEAIQGFDNSFYQPGLDVMVLGAGGVDDGEDAEVILHEYGHAMQDAQVPGFGATEEGGAMGEGFGDFQAAAYYARTSGGFGDTCFAEWDATTYGTGAVRCARRLDGTKTYPRDVKGEVHADGEIWSAFLWQVRGSLPGTAVQKSDAALRLVISSHELLTPEATFADGVAALRTTARALGHPEWLRGIDRAAGQRGLPLNP